MQKHLVLLVLVVLGSTVLPSFLVATIAFAQDTPYSEEYMEQHDGGDRNEYIQEREHSDPEFYVPAINDSSPSSSGNNATATVE
jgi:hypothetical protein